MHIDYANRPESSYEADYLRRWCARRHVALRVRVVHEVTYFSLGLTPGVRLTYIGLTSDLLQTYYGLTLDLLLTYSGDTWADSARRVRESEPGDQVHNNKRRSGPQQQEEIRSTTTNIRVTYSSYTGSTRTRTRCARAARARCSSATSSEIYTRMSSRM